MQSNCRQASLAKPLAAAASSPGTTQKRSYVEQQGAAWLLSGALLALGAALPALAVKHFSGEIAAATPENRALVILAEDILFIPVATAFLLAGELFGRQRHPRSVPYPGPFNEVDGQRTPPAWFKTYVISLPLVVGQIAPIAAGIYLASRGQLPLAASTMGAYSLTVIAQQVSEGIFVKRGSAGWVSVPNVYQTYRIWQLTRGCWLASLAAAPEWLQVLQEGLILLWVFNFGAVMTWTPWMYRWHMQPPQESNKVE